jgi:photosynthetic reaction center cytochrome c subunit
VRANTLVTLLIGVVALVAVVEILAFARHTVFRSERPPVETVQRGLRGTGMVQVYNPRTVEALVEANQVPESVPHPGEEGAKASTVYENVRVLATSAPASLPG